MVCWQAGDLLIVGYSHDIRRWCRTRCCTTRAARGQGTSSSLFPSNHGHCATNCPIAPRSSQRAHNRDGAPALDDSGLFKRYCHGTHTALKDLVLRGEKTKAKI